MDYSELIAALQNGDDVRVNTILKEITPRLIRYLEIRLGATTRDAEDAVQRTLERTLGKLREGRLDNKERVLSYLMTTARNIYFKEQDKITESNYDKVPSSEFNAPEQLETMIDEERKRILELCLEQLDDMYRRFIEYWFTHPDAETEMAADHFNISKNNAWIRKHRVIKKLNECYEEKSNK